MFSLVLKIHGSDRYPDRHGRVRLRVLHIDAPASNSCIERSMSGHRTFDVQTSNLHRTAPVQVLPVYWPRREKPTAQGTRALNTSQRELQSNLAPVPQARQNTLSLDSRTAQTHVVKSGLEPFSQQMTDKTPFPMIWAAQTLTNSNSGLAGFCPRGLLETGLIRFPGRCLLTDLLSLDCRTVRV